MPRTSKCASLQTEDKKCPQEHRIQWLEDCIAEVRSWNCINLLKLNDDKIECIVFGMAQQLKKIDNITVKVGDMETQPVQFVRNLGYLIDSLHEECLPHQQIMLTTLPDAMED